MAASAPVRDDGVVRRLLMLLCAAVVCVVMSALTAPASLAEFTPWFARSVGGATQVLSAGGDWQTSALYFGALPCFLSGALMFAARHVRPESVQ